MTDSRRYYPGLLAAVLLVLLRMAIGWHFLYEGVEKIYSTPEGRSSYLARVLPPPSLPPPMAAEKPEGPFSAEGYLRNASGPFAPYFRSLIPDPDSRTKLDPAQLKARWVADLNRLARHYRFNDAQRAEATKLLDEQAAVAEGWFQDPENAQRVRKYFADLDRARRLERNPRIIESARAQAYKDRSAAESERRELLKTVDGWTDSLHAAWQRLATPEQAEQAGPVPAPWTKMEVINALTKFGMVAVGLGLLLGLLTPAAALGGAAFLALFYLSMPPWPGLPTGPNAEGHYLYVNKNLIELIACLALATLPTGEWAGLDALLFGWRGRRRGRLAPTAVTGPALFDTGPSHHGPVEPGPSGSLSRSEHR